MEAVVRGNPLLLVPKSDVEVVLATKSLSPNSFTGLYPNIDSIKLVNAAEQVYSTLCPMVLSPGGSDRGPAPFQPKHCFFFLWKPELSGRIREMVHSKGWFR